jgi:hypothetical protein
MEEGAVFAVLLESPATVTSALLVDCRCHDDWLLADVFFFKDVGTLLWCLVNFEYASTQY